MFENNIGVKIPRILFPGKDVDLKKFAVVACDQYTSEPAYWEAVEQLTAGAPSALHLMLPEIYLETPTEEAHPELYGSAILSLT